MLWILFHRLEFHKVLRLAYNSKQSVHSLASTWGCVLCLSTASHYDPLWTPVIQVAQLIVESLPVASGTAMSSE